MATTLTTSPLVPARWRSAAAVAAALALGACSQDPIDSQCVPGVDPDCEDTTPPADEVVAGVNLTALFASPTSAEAEAARARLPQATAAQATLVPLSDAADGARRFALALDRDGQRVVTALVRVPGDAALTSRLPTLVVLPDGTDGARASGLFDRPEDGTLVTETVQVVVAYRGEALVVDGQTLASDLAPDPYRADVADVLAVLDALPSVPRASGTRVALVGVGRGGTVALLAASQAPGVDAVVSLGAPTDLFQPSFRAEARALLLGSTPRDPYPALDALAAPALALRDGAVDRAEARLRLAETSPAALGLTLPSVLAFHAVGDPVVGEDQLEALDRALQTGSGLTRIAELVDDATHDTLVDLPAVRRDVAAFLNSVL